MEAFEDFCTHLSAAIKGSPFSRAELAERLGVKPATIKSWCVGRRSPTVYRLLELSELLGIDAQVLFERSGSSSERKVCGACGRTFRRSVGYRIHLALRAREDTAHQALHDREEQVSV